MATTTITRCAVGALLTIAGPSSGLFANLITIDFETYLDSNQQSQTLSRGENLTNQYEDQYGLTFSAKKGSNSAEVWIFDTYNPIKGGSDDPNGHSFSRNDGDDDLKSPGFDQANNPGVNTTFGPGNNTGLGNVLVVQEDTTISGGTAIPDDSVDGKIIMEWDNPIDLKTLKLLDIQSGELGSRILGFDLSGNQVYNQTLSQISTGQVYGENSLVELSFASLDDITKLIVDIVGTGAIESFTFESGGAVVPEPSEVATMGILGIAAALGLRSRLKRRATQKSTVA